MGKTSNDRVIELLTSLKIDEVEASKRVGKDSSTMYRITSKKSAPTKTTLQLIATKLGASYDWLLTGNGGMFDKPVDANPWRDALVAQLKEENAKLWQMIQHYTGGAKPNFLKAFNLAGYQKYLPGKQLEAAGNA